MKDIEYSERAKERIELRGITKSEIRLTLLYPDTTEKIDFDNRRAHYKKFGNRRIKIVYKNLENRYLIISAMTQNPEDSYRSKLC